MFFLVVKEGFVLNKKVFGGFVLWGVQGDDKGPRYSEEYSKGRYLRTLKRDFDQLGVDSRAYIDASLIAIKMAISLGRTEQAPKLEFPPELPQEEKEELLSRIILKVGSRKSVQESFGKGAPPAQIIFEWIQEELLGKAMIVDLTVQPVTYGVCR